MVCHLGQTCIWYLNYPVNGKIKFKGIITACLLRFNFHVSLHLFIFSSSIFWKKIMSYCHHLGVGVRLSFAFTGVFLPILGKGVWPNWEFFIDTIGHFVKFCFDETAHLGKNSEYQAWRNCRSAGPDRQISIWSGRFNKNVGPGDRQNVKWLQTNLFFSSWKFEELIAYYIMKMKSLVVLMFAVGLLRTISKSNLLHNTYFKLVCKIANCVLTKKILIAFTYFSSRIRTIKYGIVINTTICIRHFS